jgi:restriction endonuclease Mrr
MVKPQSIDFSKLTPDKFEELCVDLLTKMGFETVRKAGQTKAADGGVDIIATEILNTKLGTEKRKIIVQCKHSKKSLNQKDIQEIDLLLRENSAQRYVLFCSSSLAKSARERLDKQGDFGINTITYFDQHSLIIEINKHKELLDKYSILREQ